MTFFLDQDSVEFTLSQALALAGYDNLSFCVSVAGRTIGGMMNDCGSLMPYDYE